MSQYIFAFVFILIVIICMFIYIVKYDSKDIESFQAPPLSNTINTDSISTIIPTMDLTLLKNKLPTIDTTKKEVNQNVKKIIPYGVIYMWNAQIPPPNGWHICDGTNGTPDLRGKFVLGATNDDAVNNVNHNDEYIKGNPDEYNLLIKDSNLPPHTHPIPGFKSYKQKGTDTMYHHGYNGGVRRYGEFELYKIKSIITQSKSNRLPKYNDPTLANQTPNDPITIPKLPSYALVYIMYVGN